MSFGFSIGDFVVLTQLAWNTVQNSRRACGVYDGLTQEVSSLHTVLQRLERESQKPTSLINREDDGRLEEIRTIVGGCGRVLRVLDQVLTKYNSLSEEKKSTTKLWKRIQFGNGEMQDLGKIRQELSTYTSAITLSLNLLSMESQGKVEEHMENHGVELKELRQSLNWITASLQARSSDREGSILTSYAGDDKAIWKEFRRELIGEGFSSSVLSKHKTVIKEYVLELGARGALDIPDMETTSSGPHHLPKAQNLADKQLDVHGDGLKGDRGDESKSGGILSREQEPKWYPFWGKEKPSRDVAPDMGIEPTTETARGADRKANSITDAQSLGSIDQPRKKPEPISIEEVEDEYFKVGASPNCEPIQNPEKNNGSNVSSKSQPNQNDSESHLPESPRHMREGRSPPRNPNADDPAKGPDSNTHKMQPGNDSSQAPNALPHRRRKPETGNRRYSIPDKLRPTSHSPEPIIKDAWPRTTQIHLANIAASRKQLRFSRP